MSQLKLIGTGCRADDVAARKTLVTNSQENYFIWNPANDILINDKHLSSGVTLRNSFGGSTNDFVVFSESNKHYKFKIFELICTLEKPQ